MIGRTIMAATLLATSLLAMQTAPSAATQVDVVVYEASSGGVGAALAAAREGLSVLLVEPTGRVGGMLTNGVTADMFRDNASTGIFDEHRQLVLADYASRGMGDHPLIRNGLYAEPEVAYRAVLALLDHPNIVVRMGTSVSSVTTSGSNVTGLVLNDGETVTAEVVIDASAVGDVLGLAGNRGIDWVAGREGSSVYSETMAPAITDDRQQAYTYRMTFQVNGRTDYSVPSSFEADRASYASLPTERVEKYSCQFNGVDYFGMRIQRCLPNGKMDINLDLVGENHAYPTDPSTRAATRSRMRDFLVGYLHYLRTERGWPELGLSIDDYPTTGGIPEVLYVREGRRAVGVTTFTEVDAKRGGVTHKPDAVAIGDYGLDSHCIGPNGVQTQGCEGGFWIAADPYQVPFGVLVPKRLDGLLVPLPASASHVGYSTLRMEPVRMNLGYVAGLTAALAIRDKDEVRNVSVPELQAKLTNAGQAIAYYPSMNHQSAGFAAEQRVVMGIRGRFSDVAAPSTHAAAILELAERGVTQGYPDGTFRAAGIVNRASFSVFLARLIGLEPATPVTFSDTSGTSGMTAGYIEALYQAGIISGYEDGTFRPADVVRREQAASLLARWLELEPLESGPFTDVPTTSFHAGNINAMYAVGGTTGMTATTYDPSSDIRRDQNASMLTRADQV